MNVLSLFDGMSCGRIALERAGIKIDNYYASEIDKNAIAISKINYPDIIQLGDVTNIKISDLPKIDILIGGSPCQGFSFLGKQLNFDDPRSKLFFEYVRILEQCRPTWFLLENVKMKAEYRDIITEKLKVKPVFICSSNFSAQKRKRYYWTNIPIKELKEAAVGPVLSDILTPSADDRYLTEKEIAVAIYKHSAHSHERTGTKMGRVKFPTPITEKAKCLNTIRITGSRDINHIQDSKGIRLLNATEYEKLQTVPVGYTASVSQSSRFKMLGNGWTVEAIAYIFRDLDLY